MSQRRPKDTWQRIYAVVRRIPRGRVATYGQVAALAGLPNHARHVGYALNALEADSCVPWHRVINAAGRISLCNAAATRQKQRLAEEDVTIDAAGNITLKQFQWRPRRRKEQHGH